MSPLSLDDLPIDPDPDSPPLTEDVGLTLNEDSPPRTADRLSREEVRSILEGRSEGTLLRSDIDRPSLAETFEREDAVRIDNVLRPAVAEYFYQEIHDRLPWTMRYFSKGELKTIPPEEWTNYSPEKLTSIRDRVGEGAREKYQILDYRYSLDSEEGEFLVDQFPRYMEEGEFQDLVESVSGMRYQDPWGQVTRMEPGNFLRLHRDEDLVGFASTLQFTKNWSPDCGGTLTMVDAEGNITNSFAPKFNSLVLFRVPVIHYVSPVAPYASKSRYLISLPGGWK